MLVIHADTRSLTRELAGMWQRQVPFANALAVNIVAKTVILAETKALDDTFKSPRKFTQQAFTQSSAYGGMVATKKLPIAIIVAKPIQERYLAPSEEPKTTQLRWQGAQHIRTPVNIRTNESGDIPKNAIAKLMAQPDVFLAEVRGVLGLWQRPTPPRPRGSGRRPKGTSKPNNSGQLRLLVAFTRPVHVKTDLRFAERAQAVVDATWPRAFSIALDKAMASAR